MTPYAIASATGPAPSDWRLPTLQPSTGDPVTGRAGLLSATTLPITVQAPDVPPWSTDRDIGVRQTGTADLPSADITAVTVSRALIEVLAGRRSAQQLAAHCAPQVFAGVLLRVPPVALALPRLQTVRVGEPADGVAEACAVFRRAERVRALAFRLEGLDGRWRITVLQIG